MCNFLHIASKNERASYSMNSTVLCNVDEEKDYRYEIAFVDLKRKKLCVRRLNMSLGFITRVFEFRSKKILLTLYGSLMCPHLECLFRF